MAKRTFRRKKASHILSKRTYYVLVVILLILILIGVYYSTTRVYGPTLSTKTIVPEQIERKEEIELPKKDSVLKRKTKRIILTSKVLELPAITDSTYLYHNKQGRYRVLYSPENKIPLFVCYILTRKEAERNIVKRSNSFSSDPYYIKKGIDLAGDIDYRRSGYDRGHLLPSADRNDSEIENISTFLYTNIAPQLPALNRGTLNALEQKIREWAVKYDSLYIVTGSILSDNAGRPTQRIGKGVAVPQYFYKVIAVKNDNNYKTIGFIMPNIESVDSDYKRYMVSVDEIENSTKIDFFHPLPDSIEQKVEKEVDVKFWR